MAAVSPLRTGSMPTERLMAALADFRPDPRLGSVPVQVQQAIHLARFLHRRGAVLRTRVEMAQHQVLARLVGSAHDKATLMQLTDQGLRPRRAARAADQLRYILEARGIPGFLGPLERVLLHGFRSLGGHLPDLSVPLALARIRARSAHVVLPAEAAPLRTRLRARRSQGLRVNLNLLGEALLGEGAAEARLQTYLAALADPAIECLSVKASTLYSQVSPLAFEATVAVLCDRLERLYREAARARFGRPDGTAVPKFVYLDMEAYHDLHITVEAFIQTLDRPGMDQIGAGIALQAYLPDAWAVQKRINGWARRRIAAGGAPVTIRLVKGANLEMERIDAAVHGWPQAPFTDKREVDANYRRMLHEGLRPENLAAVRLGVASHNLFELAYALVLAQAQGALDRVQLELLEGMANHQLRALAELDVSVLVYTPATRREDFVNAIAYLVRRLDETTGAENFLAHAFDLRVDSTAWRRLESQFLASFDLLATLPDGPRRTQDRRRPPQPPSHEDLRLEGFRNEPDTDFALPQNLAWAQGIIADWGPRHGERAAEIPLVIAGEAIFAGREIRESRDPSRPGVVVGRYREARAADLEQAVACARNDPTGWRARPPRERATLLGEVAMALRRRRAELMGAALANGGKLLTESDPEVSEAVDFVELYRRAALEFTELPTLTARPKGVVAVVPPWNFPIAIPCGGVAAALAAGNCVILKPASGAVLVAHELCTCFWEAGVPREVLQFMPAAGSGVGAALIAHPQVDVVILTGGTKTALEMLEARPDLSLMAETGGKNATIVTALADRDEAIEHVLHSAFSHSGQKCSATSLLILEAEVYDDPAFEAALCDAVQSLPVGSAWDRRTRIAPLIRPPQGALARALSSLEPGERWAVQPRMSADNPQLVTPGVKWGVRPGSFTHMTELFGPVLAVMRARDLDEAIAMVNATGYGLTSGLESLDPREQQAWQARIHAGNLYINRVTTGAVVLRQPFGGMGKSVFGPGIKAGGPNYVVQLMDLEERVTPARAEAVADPLLEDLRARLEAERAVWEGVPPEVVDRILGAIASYDRAMAEEFGREHDPVCLLGQDNIRRYRPVADVRVRLHEADGPFDLYARICAARAVGCRITVSRPPGLAVPGLAALVAATAGWGEAIAFVEEGDAALAEAIRAGDAERVRYAAPDRVAAAIFEAAREPGRYVARAPVLVEGRIELLWYLREQSISHDYHRYGNLGERGAAGRAPAG